MGCRCNERGVALRGAVKAAVRGDVRTVAQAAGYVARTLAQDARSGDLQRAASLRLAQMRGVRK